jgi:hypothetical protein
MTGAAQIALATLLWLALALWGGRILRHAMLTREAAAGLPRNTPTRLARRMPWAGLAAWLALATAAGIVTAWLPSLPTDTTRTAAPPEQHP